MLRFPSFPPNNNNNHQQISSVLVHQRLQFYCIPSNQSTICDKSLLTEDNLLARSTVFILQFQSLKKISSPSMGRKKISTLFSLVCLLLTGLLLIINISFDDVFTHVQSSICFNQRNSFMEASNSTNQNNSSKQGCVMPHVDPFDPFIRPYLNNISLNCFKSPQLTAIDNNDRLIVQIPDPKPIGPFDCYYSWVYRYKSDSKVSYGRVKQIPPHGVKFADGDAIVVNTSCVIREKKETIYRNIHFRMPKFNLSKSSSSSKSSSLVDIKPSVMILVIESLGRLSFERFMSSTRKILDKIGNFHHLTALNRVEENSFPNSLALLTGIAITDDAASKFTGVHWDNRLPFIWDQFKSLDYVTAFLEDQPMVGLFSYYNRGFIKPPTDFYPVEFWSHMYPKGADNLYQLLTNPFHYCYEKVGAKVDIYLDMCTKFMENVHTAQHRPYFLYAFYSQMTHENFLNFQLLDKPVAQFFSSLPTSVLNNTILMLIGDHGPRMGVSTAKLGDPTDSPLGRLEGSLPFAAIRIPDSLDAKYPHLRKYLSLNEERLSTWFDVNKMLHDTALGNFKPVGHRTDVPVAYSLFREEVPITRTCEDAYISSSFCACNGRIGINPEFKSHHDQAAKGLVDSLRSILYQNKCRPYLSRGKTLAGEYFYPIGPNQTWSTYERVNLTVEVRPSHAIVTGQVFRWRDSTEDRWSPWTIYDPNNLLKSAEHLGNLTKSVCSDDRLKKVNITLS